MILINPRKELILPARLTVGMEGWYRIRSWRPDNVLHRARIDTGWFKNTILNNGRNNMASQANWLTHCHIGTSSIPPTQGDTTLGGFVVSTSTITEDTNSAQGSAPYFGWRRKTYRFNQGAGHGGQNLSEAGVGWSSTGSVLVSRALIVDPDTQLPTTVTPLEDEILDVTYEMRYYPPLSDVNNSVTLAGTNYDTVTRASLVTNSIWSAYIGTSIGERSPTADTWRVYDGVLGTLEQQPNGTWVGHDSGDMVNETYQNNSYQRVIQAPTGPTGWNIAGGFRSIYIETTAGAYQTQFSSNPGGNTVPKDATYTLHLEWTLSWTEKV